MANSSGNASDDDSAPESISFNAGKTENTEQLLNIKEQVCVFLENSL